MRQVGTSTNTADEASVLDGVTLNTSTSTTILAAQAAGDQPRIKVIVQNGGATAVWIKLQPAADDDDVKGFLLGMSERQVILEGSDIYTGEISAIAAAGAPEVFVTWF